MGAAALRPGDAARLAAVWRRDRARPHDRRAGRGGGAAAVSPPGDGAACSRAGVYGRVRGPGVSTAHGAAAGWDAGGDRWGAAVVPCARDAAAGYERAGAGAQSGAVLGWAA